MGSLVTATSNMNISVLYSVTVTLDFKWFNRPFERSGHMVRNKLCWDGNDAVGLPKQRN